METEDGIHVAKMLTQMLTLKCVLHGGGVTSKPNVSVQAQI